MSAVDTPRRPARQRRPARPILSLPGLMALEALTVAVFSTLHLSGALHIGSGARHSYGAGVAEALICLALALGAWGLMRSPGRRGRRVALSAVGFAIFGFLVGLTFTIGGGDTIDLAYHLLMLPVLVATVVLITRRPSAHPPRVV
jgi:hypothetical protein